MSGMRPFGFDTLDTALGGGLPVGKLAVLEPPAESQSELLLERLSVAHDVLYVATERPAGEVTDQLRDAGGDPEPTAVAEATPSALLADDAFGRADIPENGVVVVDPLDGLEAGDREPYLEWLRASGRPQPTATPRRCCTAAGAIPTHRCGP